MIALVVAPVAVGGWLGTRAVDDRVRVVAQDLDESLQAQLRTIDAAVARSLERRRTALVAELDALPRDLGRMRDHLRARPAVGHVLVLDRRGEVLFPPLTAPASDAERAFLERSRTVWRGRELPARAAEAEQAGVATAGGWHGWYHHGGLHLLVWQVEEDRIVAAELSRVELMHVVVADLPETRDDDLARTLLVDASDRPVYAWGTLEPDPDAPPRAELPLSAPLAAWRLRHHDGGSAATAAVAAGLRSNLALGLGALGLALTVLAGWLYLERTREMRLAARRVSFVHQVSHELRTPLTNIRLYAELLQEDREHPHLDIIVGESQRLGRLIDNVLSFARGQQGRMRLAPALDEPDRVVRSAVEAFTPALEARGVRVAHREGAPGPALVDRDALAQIVSNLLGNVEKYAASGGAVEVVTERDGADVRVRVSDQGPGIPRGLRERIFEPFVRASDELTEGVSGVGLGLDIARRLARLHGGDLVLLASPAGATFEARIAAPVAPNPGGPP